MVASSFESLVVRFQSLKRLLTIPATRKFPAELNASCKLSISFSGSFTRRTSFAAIRSMIVISSSCPDLSASCPSGVKTMPPSVPPKPERDGSDNSNVRNSRPEARSQTLTASETVTSLLSGVKPMNKTPKDAITDPCGPASVTTSLPEGISQTVVELSPPAAAMN